MNLESVIPGKLTVYEASSGPIEELHFTLSSRFNYIILYLSMHKTYNLFATVVELVHTQQVVKLFSIICMLQRNNIILVTLAVLFLKVDSQSMTLLADWPGIVVELPVTFKLLVLEKSKLNLAAERKTLSKLMNHFRVLKDECFSQLGF